MAAKANLIIDQGSKFSITVNITNNTGDVFNLSNYTSACHFRKSYSSSTFYTISTNITDPTGGIMSLIMDSADTAVVTAGRYVYDIEVYDTNNGNNATRVLEGLISVTPGVTRGN
jgi:hypothetical protein